jgi:hypothetical protein
MIGDTIRELLESKNILPRQEAALSDMNTPIPCKMEHRHHLIRKVDIVAPSKIREQSQIDLPALWFAPKILKMTENE